MKQDKMTRRAWLQGAAGASLAVPFLPSLFTMKAAAQVEGAPPRRFVFVGSPYGRDISNWFPSADPEQETDGVFHARLDVASGQLSQILGPAYANVAKHLSLLRGLDGMQISGDGHSPTFALTGSGSQGGRMGFPYSLDAVLEESPLIYPAPPFASAVRSCPSPTDNTLDFSCTSKNGPMQWLRSDSSPLVTYHKLFAPAQLARREARAERQAPVVNAVMDDYRALLQSKRLSQADAYKLDAHLSLLSDIEASLMVSAPSCSGVQPVETLDSAEKLHEVAMSLEIAALSCGLTRIVTHSILHHDSGLVPNDGEAHSAAHNGRSRREESGRDPVDQWVMNKWTMARVAQYIEMLSATPDGTGSLLDNTIFLYGNVEARGFHSFYDMPVILAGSPDLFRLGEYIDFRPRPLLTYSGAPPIYPGRPYNNILVTILKAMGLQEADYQKFGQRGFGVYDKFDVAGLADHYRPYLLQPDAPLPYVYRAV